MFKRLMLVMFVLLAMPGAAFAQDGPEGTVTSFYTWYLDYAGYDEETDVFNNPLVDGAYKARPELSVALLEKIEATLASFEHAAYDPILCAQDIPESFTVEMLDVSDGQAGALLHQYFGGNPHPHTITVWLLEQNGGWVMDDIVCGENTTPRGVVENFYRWYLDYARETGNPLVDEIYRDYVFLTGDLIAQVDAELAAQALGGGDPFLCAQDIPASFAVNVASVTAESASVIVRAYFANNPEPHTLAVKLVNEAGQWMIGDILCEVGPGEIAALLYNEFITFMRYDLANSVERVPLADWSRYPWQPHLSADLLESLVEVYERGETRPADPFLCAQDIPEWVEVEVETLSEDGAAVRVSGSYPAGPDSYESYDLVVLEMNRTSEGYWQLTGITCAE